MIWCLFIVSVAVFIACIFYEERFLSTRLSFILGILSLFISIFLLASAIALTEYCILLNHQFNIELLKWWAYFG